MTSAEPRPCGGGRFITTARLGGVVSETRNRTDDGADRATTDHGGRPCPRCGEAMIHRHCKYVCPVHGVVYDCSDTFY